MSNVKLVPEDLIFPLHDVLFPLCDPVSTLVVIISLHNMIFSLCSDYINDHGFAAYYYLPFTLHCIGAQCYQL